MSKYMNETSTKISHGGRVVIPAQHRRALGLKTGDEVILRLVDGELHILSRAEAVRRAQDMVRRHNKKGRSLVKELAAARRAEAARE
jgi:AbrB family looped-hinge helix DNA binding protein